MKRPIEDQNNIVKIARRFLDREAREIQYYDYEWDCSSLSSVISSGEERAESESYYSEDDDEESDDEVTCGGGGFDDDDDENDNDDYNNNNNKNFNILVANKYIYTDENSYFGDCEDEGDGDDDSDVIIISAKDFYKNQTRFF